MEPRFVVRRGEVYTSEQVISAYQISNVTLEKWVADGLRIGRKGTRRRYFLGDDLIEFMFGDKTNGRPKRPIGDR